MKKYLYGTEQPIEILKFLRILTSMTLDEKMQKNTYPLDMEGISVWVNTQLICNLKWFMKKSLKGFQT